MAKLNITPQDHLKGKVIPPGIYKVEVKNVEESASKTDQSQNWNVEFKILEGDYVGVPLYKTFNEKGAGFAIPFVESCGGKIDPTKPFELDFNKAIGSKLRVVVKNALYQGNMKNQIDGFMPLN